MQTFETTAVHSATDHAREELDHGYYPTPSAHIYTSAHWTGKIMTRFYATIAIAPNYCPFEVQAAGRSDVYGAVALRPLVQLSKRVTNGSVLTVHLEPPHLLFRAFHELPSPGLLAIERARFAQVDAELHAACRGELTLDESAVLIERVVDIVAPLLPKAKPPDPRVIDVCEHLRRQPNVSLSEIAASLNLSYNRTSHLFTEAIGLPFRSYQLWQKFRRANRWLWEGESLTTAAHRAGFADSAHLCRTYQQLVGRPPSYFVDGKYVKLHAHAPLPAGSRKLL
jgi:AraC-like DNA-binding protein